MVGEEFILRFTSSRSTTATARLDWSGSSGTREAVTTASGRATAFPAFPRDFPEATREDRPPPVGTFRTSPPRPPPGTPPPWRKAGGEDSFPGETGAAQLQRTTPRARNPGIRAKNLTPSFIPEDPFLEIAKGRYAPSPRTGTGIPSQMETRLLRPGGRLPSLETPERRKRDRPRPGRRSRPVDSGRAAWNRPPRQVPSGGSFHAPLRCWRAARPFTECTHLLSRTFPAPGPGGMAMSLGPEEKESFAPVERDQQRPLPEGGSVREKKILSPGPRRSGAGDLYSLSFLCVLSRPRWAKPTHFKVSLERGRIGRRKEPLL